MFDVAENVENRIGQIRDNITKLTLNVSEGWNDLRIFDAVERKAIDYVEATKEKAKFAVAKAATYLERTATNVVKKGTTVAGRGIGTAVGSLFGPAGAAIGGTVGAFVGEWVGEKIGEKVVKPLINKGKEIANKAIDYVADTAKSVVSTGVEVVKDVVSSVGLAISSGARAVASFFGF
ncbi:hypothetical protein O1Q81_00385 [Lonepinella sp. MS14436]